MISNFLWSHSCFIPCLGERVKTKNVFCQWFWICFNLWTLITHTRWAPTAPGPLPSDRSCSCASFAFVLISIGALEPELWPKMSGDFCPATPPIYYKPRPHDKKATTLCWALQPCISAMMPLHNSIMLIHTNDTLPIIHCAFEYLIACIPSVYHAYAYHWQHHVVLGMGCCFYVVG